MRKEVEDYFAKILTIFCLKVELLFWRIFTGDFFATFIFALF